MLRPEDVISTLRERGELRDLMHAISSGVAELCREETSDEWDVPAGIALETLERAGYFESFPQWLTVASHLTDDSTVLERIASSASPAAEARRSIAQPDSALS